MDVSLIAADIVVNCRHWWIWVVCYSCLLFVHCLLDVGMDDGYCRLLLLTVVIVVHCLLYVGCLLLFVC